MASKKNFEYSPDLYDLQINWDFRLSKEKIFFDKIINNKKLKKILDIGCGTGHHAQLFSGMAESVTAMDPSAEMIEYAGKNIVKSGNVKLIAGGFEKIDTLFPQAFDMVTCIGNTIVLLENRKNVKHALKNVRKILAPGGFAVFQFLNFEPKIIDKNRYYQPKIVLKDGDKYIFMKHFEYGKVKTRAEFIITHLNSKDDIENFSVNTSFFCTLRKKLFLKMAHNSGFKKVVLYGADGKEEFNKNRDISLYAVLYR